MVDPHPSSVFPVPLFLDLGQSAPSLWPPRQVLPSAERRSWEYEESFSFPLFLSISAFCFVYQRRDVSCLSSPSLSHSVRSGRHSVWALGSRLRVFCLCLLQGLTGCLHIGAVLHVVWTLAQITGGPFPLVLALALLLLTFLRASLVHCSNTRLNSLDLALILGPLSP